MDTTLQLDMTIGRVATIQKALGKAVFGRPTPVPQQLNPLIGEACRRQLPNTPNGWIPGAAGMTATGYA